MDSYQNHSLNSNIYHSDGSLNTSTVRFDNVLRYKTWNAIPSFPHHNEPSNGISFTNSKTPFVTELSLNLIKSNYIDWVNDDLYFVLQCFDNNTYQSIFKWCKCAKRGNDVYKHRVKSRLYDIINYSDDIHFFNPKDRDLFKKDVYTSALYIVLTDDSKRCSLQESWDSLGYEFNKYLSSLRRSYGSISYIRSWESFKSGRPHINIVIYFKDYKFKVFRDTKNKFRIKEKKGFESWHSFVDVQAMYSLKGALSYITKYITKDLLNSTDSSISTLSLLWYFRKRSYSVSKDFLKIFEKIRLDYFKHNSINYHLKIGQISKNPNLEYHFIGVFKLDFKKEWFFITKIPPDEYILTSGFD